VSITDTGATSISATDTLVDEDDLHALALERGDVPRIGARLAQVQERDVEAMLAFAVDPAAAGAFSREAVQNVTAAEGTIAESRITGENAGTPLPGTLSPWTSPYA